MTKHRAAGVNRTAEEAEGRDRIAEGGSFARSLHSGRGRRQRCLLGDNYHPLCCDNESKCGAVSCRVAVVVILPLSMSAYFNRRGLYGSANTCARVSR